MNFEDFERLSEHASALWGAHSDAVKELQEAAAVFACIIQELLRERHVEERHAERSGKQKRGKSSRPSQAERLANAGHTLCLAYARKAMMELESLEAEVAEQPSGNTS